MDIALDILFLSEDSPGNPSGVHQDQLVGKNLTNVLCFTAVVFQTGTKNISRGNTGIFADGCMPQTYFSVNIKAIAYQTAETC